MSKRTLIAAMVALGLGAGAAAQSPLSTRPEPSLQDRVDALSQQITLRYQHYVPALQSHRAAAEEVLAAWNAVAPAGESRASDENAARLAAWLDAALRAVMPGGSGRLPAAPEFVAPLPEEVVPAAPHDLPKSTGVESPEAAPTPALDAPPASLPEPRPSRLKVIDPVTTIDNPYVNDSAPVVARPTTKEAVGPSPIAKEPSGPRPSANPLRQTPPAPEAVVGVEPAKSRFVGPRATAKPVTPAPELRETEAPQRSKWSQHPSAAPLEWRDPFTDDPTASPNPLRSGSRHEARRPEFQASPSTRVDLRQLSAEIRGYNAALRSLQSAVMRLAENDTAALAAAEAELGQLDERRQFLDLYREGLSPAERQALPESPSADVLRELVRRKTEALTGQAPSLNGQGQSRRAERRAQQGTDQLGLESF